MGKILAACAAVLALIAALFLFTRPAAPAPVNPAAASQSAGVVILIPGFGGGSGSLIPLYEYLTSKGRTVIVADIGDGKGDIASYGKVVSALVADSIALGWPSADLVGFSEGGLIARSAFEVSPESVRRLVTISSPHDGTALAALGAYAGKSACPLSCEQMQPGSEFLASLAPFSDPARTLSIYASSDEVIRPADSSRLDGASNFEVLSACSAPKLAHSDIPSYPGVMQVVDSFLTSGSIPSTCQ